MHTLTRLIDVLSVHASVDEAAGHAPRAAISSAPDKTNNTKRKRKTMASTAQFTIGTKASCSDGACGEVTRVIVDPVAEAVTHLVVEPKHRRDTGRLVPLDLVDCSTGEVHLRCTVRAFDNLGRGRGDATSSWGP